MKLTPAFAFLLILTLLVTPAAAAPMKKTAAQPQQKIDVVVHDKPLQLSSPAYLDKGTAMVPLRQIAEALGAQVTAGKDAGKQTVTINGSAGQAVLTIGSVEMAAQGRTVQLPAAPQRNGNVTFVPVRALSEALGAVVIWDAPKRTVRIAKPVELPTVDTPAKLSKLIAELPDAYRYSTAMKVENAVTADGMQFESVQAEASPAAEPAGQGYSQTNVQVNGVDEADWAKTDGSYIYQISGSKVRITSIADPEAPKLTATLEYAAEQQFYPQELYVDSGKLVVIGHHNVPLRTFDSSGKPLDQKASKGGKAADSDAAASSGPSSNVDAQVMEEAVPDMFVGKRGIGIWYPMANNAKALIYKLNAGGQPLLERELELEGSYISSRKIGSALYLITSKYNDVYPMINSEDQSNNNGSLFEPLYRDSAVSKKTQALPLDKLHYFPKSPETSTMLIGAVDIDQPDQEMQVSAYLGSGQTIYASARHLYVAFTDYSSLDGDNNAEQTKVHKFRLDHGRIVYIGEGAAPGTILNQFSMDEHEGYFRIATTKGNMFASGEETSKNNIYVLDEQLQIAGKLENLAPGERIYSARFMGKRAYMVTFRNVDPLFAIDLANPAKPAVLGQLKIPGYSDYLHPYDENHLIGFGKETIELPSKGQGPDETIAYYQGMKMALFDVSDVNHPKEKFKEIIGDRDTYSELLQNHKALLFSRQLQLLAFPVNLMEVKDKRQQSAEGGLAYGEFTYQGAYIYRIDPLKGFELRGRITHISDEEMMKSGYYGADYAKYVKRIMYAGDTLYTLSEGMLKANDLHSLTERGSVIYPAADQ
ncbi:hypothetical protein EBB07_34020 [Paenibacillaceae bacterium]|nr:hypothetical protein EBB07_34020 [Paenibacillaceae bacterium]